MYMMRLLSLCLLSIGLAILGFWAGNQLYKNDLVYANVSHLFNAKTHLNIDLFALRGGQTVEEIKRQFPDMNWDCRADNNLPRFGDYSCVDENLQAWNGNPAMYAVFWFKNGRLANLKIDFPHEKHGQVKSYLIEMLGRPNGGGKREIGQADLVVWKLETGGLLSFNIDPEPNPMQWTTLLWNAPEEVAQMGEILDQSQNRESSYDLAEDVVRKLIRHLSTK